MALRLKFFVIFSTTTTDSRRSKLLRSTYHMNQRSDVVLQ